MAQYRIIATNRESHEAFVKIAQVMVAKANANGYTKGIEIWARQRDDGPGEIAFNEAATSRLAAFLDAFEASAARTVDTPPEEGWEPLAIVVGRHD